MFSPSSRLSSGVLLLPFLCVLLVQNSCHAQRLERDVNKPNLTCYECGVIFRSEAGSFKDLPCRNDSSQKISADWKVRRNCAVCLKTYTVVDFDFRKPRWGSDQRAQVEESRMCLVDHEPYHPIGSCVRSWGAGTYSERCYCSSKLCNSAQNFSAPSMLVSFMAVLITTCWAIL